MESTINISNEIELMDTYGYRIYTEKSMYLKKFLIHTVH